MLFWKRWIPLMVAALLAAGMWAVYGFVTPALRAEAALKNLPRGDQFRSDLYPRWLGARELLLHERDPYSAEVTAEIQKGKYGRILDPQNPAEPSDEARFAYPLYVVFLLAPTVIFPFRLVELGYMLLIAILSAASVILWVRAFGVHMNRQALAAGMVLMLGSWPVVHGLYWQQLSLFVASMIAGAAAAVAAGALWIAGILLALATIKPHLSLPVAGWLLLWAGSKWRERKALPLAFTAAMAALLVGAELLLPGWFWRWYSAISAYSRYTQATTPLVQLLCGKYLGGFLWVAVLATLLSFCWRMRLNTANSDGFKLALVCVICGPLVLMPTPVWYLYNQVLILPAVVAGLVWRNEFSRLSAVGRIGVAICACLLVWPWVLALVVSAIALASPVTAQKTAVTLVFFPTILAPIAALCAVVLLGAQRMRGNSRDTGSPEPAV